MDESAVKYKQFKDILPIQYFPKVLPPNTEPSFLCNTRTIFHMVYPVPFCSVLVFSGLAQCSVMDNFSISLYPCFFKWTA